ncbi:MAG: Unknown protein, partial [uncultured Thiotrichaceae bacterium]
MSNYINGSNNAANQSHLQQRNTGQTSGTYGANNNGGSTGGFGTGGVNSSSQLQLLNAIVSLIMNMLSQLQGNNSNSGNSGSDTGGSTTGGSTTGG